MTTDDTGRDEVDVRGKGGASPMGELSEAERLSLVTAICDEFRAAGPMEPSPLLMADRVISAVERIVASRVAAVEQEHAEVRDERNHWIGEAKRYERLYRSADDNATRWFKRMKTAEATIAAAPTVDRPEVDR